VFAVVKEQGRPAVQVCISCYFHPFLVYVLNKSLLTTIELFFPHVHMISLDL
jgi:hypothetical protein